MNAWLWIVMFVLGLALVSIVGLWISQRRDQAHLDQFNQSLRESFAALSAEALKNNAGEQREELERTLKPVQETLQRTQEQMREIERERHTAYGKLTQQMKDAVAAQEALRKETQNLSQALSRPEVRGSYGEITLRRVIELAGMTRHVDFFEQEQQSGLRPDVIVRLPENRVLPIDAKAPLQLYQDAYRQTDAEAQKVLMQRFAEAVRNMVKNLSDKDYAGSFTQENALDFVVMFMPGDQFLNAALEYDADLMDFALQKRVLLTTPSSLMAILRAVAYGWNQKKLAEGAEQIRALGQELYERTAVFAGYMTKLRSSLSSSVDHYNRMIGAWERRILPTSRRFQELGIDSNKEVAEAEEIDQTLRSLSQPESDPDDSS